MLSVAKRAINTCFLPATQRTTHVRATQSICGAKTSSFRQLWPQQPRDENGLFCVAANERR